jgi:hypothetical protein
VGRGVGRAAPLRIGAGTIKAEAKATAVAEAYETKRREAEAAWRTSLADPAKPAPGDVSRAERAKLAAMEPAGREAALRSVAAAQALAELTREAHDAERALEAAELVAAPEVREELGRRRAILRAELARLGERFEAERRVNLAIGAAAAAAEAEVAERARERLAARRAEEAKTSALERMKPWGCETKKGADHEAARKR